jgi:hypothetical protein
MYWKIYGTLLMFIFGTFLVPQLISSKESIALLLMKIKDNNGVPKIRTRRYPGERALGRLYIAVAATFDLPHNSQLARW